MASLARSLSTRVSRIEKPKPLKTIIPSRHSFSDKSDLLQHATPEPAVELKTPDTPTRSAADDLIMLLDIVSSSILNKDYANILPLTNNLTNRLKCYGSQLEEYNEERLDKIFEVIRNGAHDILIDRQSRLNLLQLVELRASQWQLSPGASLYYASKSGYHHEVGDVYGDGGFDLSQQQLLGPGDVLKSSGKYSSPTRVPGKNYCKDEVVIRNSDSGKVNPGAKERLVQITGPSEDKIIYAKSLIEDTIKRNASPVREIGVGVGCREAAGSNSSINSSASDESNRLLSSTGRPSGTGKDSTEFKYSVHVQNDVIHISSTNLNLLNEAFSLLDSSYAAPEETLVLSPQTLITKAVQNLSSSSNSEQSPSLPSGEISHSESDKAREEIQESDQTPSRGKSSKGVFIQYSRDFLLQCSKYKASQVPPADYASLVAETPAIWTKSATSFDALVYQKKWLETNGRIATHPTTAEDFLDSD